MTSRRDQNGVTVLIGVTPSNNVKNNIVKKMRCFCFGDRLSYTSTRCYGTSTTSADV